TTPWRIWPAASASRAAPRYSRAMTLAVDAIPGLICLWDFQETPHGDLVSVGPHRYALTEMNGPIERASGGVLGPRCLGIRRGQWLRLPRRDCPALDLHGRASLTVMAWVARGADNLWQYIAGMWDERGGRRQYALFTSGHKQAHCNDLTR